MNTDIHTFKPTAVEAINDHRMVDMALDSLDVGIIVLDRNANIMLTNARARKDIPHICHAHNLGDYLCPLDPATTWKSILQAVLESSIAQPVDCTSPHNDQPPPTIFKAKCKLLRHPNGEATESVIVIWERQTRDDNPTDQQDLMRRLASLGKLTSHVAHELNNPLDGILRYTNLALRLADANTDKRLSMYLQESRTGIKRMVHIISDLLEYSRSAGKDFDESDINEIVEQALKSVTEGVDTTRLNISLDLHHENMPYVRGSRLYQVCCNLIKNAVDAMPDGGQLTVTTGITEDHVVICIADTGMGLPQDGQDIFQPFVTTKAPGKGTGLGLSICKDFIEDMNGSITAESNHPQGAIFTTKIPVMNCET